MIELENNRFSGKVIVASNCSDSVNLEKSKIEIKHNDRTLSNCSWTMFAPTKSQIILSITGDFNKHALNIYDSIRYADNNLFTETETSILESPTNILRIKYSSKTASSHDGLIIQYKTTGKRLFYWIYSYLRQRKIRCLNLSQSTIKSNLLFQMQLIIK